MTQFKYSAPGSTLLLGEYAVLHKGYALVCAVDQRVSVQLTARMDDQVEIISSLGTYKTTVKQLEGVAPFQFILATLKKYQKRLKQGCTLTIESEFSDKVGLASSAAVTVATLASVAAWLRISYTPLQLIRQARSIVQTVQGMGSGADVAACVLGGIVSYRKWPLQAKKIGESCPLHLIYSGNKVPTPVVVKQVKERFLNYPKIYKQLIRAINECTKQGIAAFKNQDLATLGQIMIIQQGLMQSLGVSTPILEGIIKELVEQPVILSDESVILSNESVILSNESVILSEAKDQSNFSRSFASLRMTDSLLRMTERLILGAKISGSGLGDSVIALGTLSDNYISRFAAQGVKRIPMTIASEGVRREKI